jgi:hypothetical protein
MKMTKRKSVKLSYVEYKKKPLEDLMENMEKTAYIFLQMYVLSRINTAENRHCPIKYSKSPMSDFKEI